MRRAFLIALLAGAAALISLYQPAGALALPGPTVTLTSPAQAAVIAGGQPTFSGTGGTVADSATVIIRVYGGPSATGAPVQTLPTKLSGSRYSVGPSSPLADGEYTAEAEQDDLLGDRGFSQAVTFTVHNALPRITLSPPGATPFLTSTPTLSGTGGTAFGDSATVALSVYSGTGTTQSPAELLSAAAPGGPFTVQISPGLPDGEYTAVATQKGVAGVGTSAPQTFEINANAPIVTLDDPAAGSQTPNAEPLFSGVADNVAGDAAQVTVSLYLGAGTNGQPIGTVNVTTSGTSWSVRWPTPLALGQYTAQATQDDDVGHTGFSAPDTFQIVATPYVVGSSVKLARGTVSVSVRCGLSSGLQCAGDVLILTVRKFQPVRGAPGGPLRVMFAYVSIPGGRSALVRRHVPGPVARALRRAGKVSVRVSTALSAPGGSPTTRSAIRRLRRG